MEALSLSPVATELTKMINFVYFDLGGVVIKDFSGTNKWEEMKKEIGVQKNLDTEFDELYDKYEREGLCLSRDVDSLIPIFSKEIGIHFPPNFSILKYLVDHFEENPTIWPVIACVQKSCRVGMLTNMYPRMFSEIEKRNILPLVNWDVIIDSTVVGLQKPDPKIFQLAEEKSEAKHNEILFIDNTGKNIEAAKKFGWQTFLYSSSKSENSSKELSKYLKDLGITDNI